ncbi:hypothetical protein ACJJTC_000244 [Scirpophaga incertulas]
MWLLLPLLITPALGLGMIEPPLITRTTKSNPQERFVNVRKDQFSRTKNDTFPMRFYYNELSATDKNIVVFVGAEWTINPSGASGGMALDIATAIGASLFYTEHRYYGKSKLTADISASALELLSIDQALRDLAQFIEYVKSNDFEGGQYKSAKVVLFGCSLAGSISVWMRHLYPRLVDVAVSDSGPLVAQEDFKEFFEVTTNVLRFYGGDQCVQTIKDATDAILAVANTTKGDELISNTFNTCTDFVGSDPMNIYTLFDGITTVVSDLVMTARPGNVKANCAKIANTTISNPMQRLATWMSERIGGGCIMGQYEQMLELYGNTSYNGFVAENRMWRYYMCYYFGWFQSTTSTLQPFGYNLPVEFFRRNCRDFFSSEYDASMIEANMRRTNTFLGSFLPDHVIHMRGTEDPWSVLQPTLRQNTSKTPVYEIKASHCRATNSIQDSVTEEIRTVKKKVLQHVKDFIRQ